MSIFAYDKELKKSEYEMGIDKGFEVLFVHDIPYLKNNAQEDMSTYFDIEKNPDFKMCEELWISTPYKMQDGNPVIGYLFISLNSLEKTDLKNSGCLQEELWINDNGKYRNIDDVYGDKLDVDANSNSKIKLFDGDGKPIKIYSEAMDELIKFGIAAAKEDHVLSFSEWRFKEKSKNNSLKSRDIAGNNNTKEGYYNYLKNVMYKMQNPQVIFIGNIKTPGDIKEKIEENEKYQAKCISMNTLMDPKDFEAFKFAIDQLDEDSVCKVQDAVIKNNKKQVEEIKRDLEVDRQNALSAVTEYVNNLTDDNIRGSFYDLKTRDINSADITSEIRMMQDMSISDMKRELIDETMEYWSIAVATSEPPTKQNVKKWFNDNLMPDTNPNDEKELV